MKSNHTKGHWGVVKNMYGEPIIYSENERVVTSIAKVFNTGKEVNANANLMAAAPKLLDALIELKKTVVRLAEQGHINRECAAIKAAELMIEKASINF